MKKALLLGLLVGVMNLQAQDLIPTATPVDRLALLVRTLAKMDSPSVQLNILRGMNASLRGQRGLAAPVGWEDLYQRLKDSPSEDVRQQARALAVIFGGGAVLDELRKTLADPQASVDSRRAALDSIVAARDAAAAPVLLELLKAPGPLRAAAIRGLASYDAATIPAALVAGYAGFDTAEKRDALNTLLARPASARALLAAIDAKTIDKGAITAPLARTLQSLKDGRIDEWMAANWGAVRSSSADKQGQIARMKQFLGVEQILRADVSRGRAIFNQTCGVCHTMFGVGGKIGPELPGAFEDVDYLLQNIVDPNAIIGKDYQQTFIMLKDGRSVSGIVTGDDAVSLNLKTLGETLSLQRADIAEIKISEQSMMPEGLLTIMDEESVRDLFLYLRQRAQVPLLATPLNANDFFNGTDFATWRSEGEGWRVEAGEIIGRGTAARPVGLMSQMIVGDFLLSGEIKITGPGAAAEFVAHGAKSAGRFNGHSLSLGGVAPANLFDYRQEPPKPSQVPGGGDFSAWTPISIAVEKGRLQVTIGQATAAEVQVPTSRTMPAIYLYGANAELRIRHLKLTVPH